MTQHLAESREQSRASTDEFVLRLTEVHRVYGSGRTAVRALDGVSMRVRAGELVAVSTDAGSAKLVGLRSKPYASWAWTRWPTATPTRCPAVNSSGWPSPGP